MRKAIVIACILCASAAQADPSPSVTYLMAEPVSQFEWGIFRLQERANHFAWDHLEIKSQHAHVTYDWPKNQLQIEMIIYPRYQGFQRTTAREVCGSLIHQMKVLLAVTPGMEELRATYGVGSFFRPQQFEKQNSPKTLDADLEEITNLEVELYVGKSDQPPFENVISCSSDLLKPETKFFTTSQMP